MPKSQGGQGLLLALMDEPHLVSELTAQRNEGSDEATDYRKVPNRNGPTNLSSKELCRYGPERNIRILPLH
jgi:hypothetical protein